MYKGGIKGLSQAYATAKLSPMEILQKTVTHMQEHSNLNAFNYAIDTTDDVLKLAEESEKRYKEGTALSVLDGVPISFKDNFLVK